MKSTLSKGAGLEGKKKIGWLKSSKVEKAESMERERKKGLGRRRAACPQTFSGLSSL
ncbi:MAG: hypothetical protein LAN61_14735 [Acidobacteriia bacterium]|nr:hypothetical protein [Terriglobia bacterium]